MELKVKILRWSAGLPIAMLDGRTAEKIGVHSRDRISLKTESKISEEIMTLVNTSEDMVKTTEIGVSSELKKRLALKNGQKVDVNLGNSPKSIAYVKKKLDKGTLTQKEINEIMEDIVSNALSEPEIALFISAMYKQGMTMKETAFLINAIIKSGKKLNLKNKFSADKHSIGGIPGNRTTPIVVSICAAAGLFMPKTSSRAITSAAGTADVIETIADIEIPMEKLKQMLKKTNACLIWGGSLGIVPADSKIIRVEKLLRIDPQAQLLASIMSKKLAMGAEHILIDIPFGKGAKVDKKQALELKKKFEHLGKQFGKKLECILTDGTQPIGNGIGPTLELMDIIKVLDPEKQGPKDLMKKSLLLAGKLLEMTKKATKGKGTETAEEILRSGKAYAKFREIIKAQNGDFKRIKYAKFRKDVTAKKSGKIAEIENKKINGIARTSGCPVDKSAGVYLHVRLNEKVKKGQTIITIYSETKNRLNGAVRQCRKLNPVKINP